MLFYVIIRTQHNQISSVQTVVPYQTVVFMHILYDANHFLKCTMLHPLKSTSLSSSQASPLFLQLPGLAAPLMLWAPELSSTPTLRWCHGLDKSWGDCVAGNTLNRQVFTAKSQVAEKMKWRRWKGGISMDSSFFIEDKKAQVLGLLLDLKKSWFLTYLRCH